MAGDEEGSHPVPPQFRIVHLLYATALVGAALATCGVLGLALAAVVLVGWYVVFGTDFVDFLCEHRPRVVECMAFVSIVAVFAAMLLPAFQQASSGHRSNCRSNLAQVAIALKAYHEDHGAFPPAFIPDKEGRPMHSWRVLLLPYMDQIGAYESYRFDEPWDGPNNRKLASLVVEGYQCPGHDPFPRGSTTAYFAVVGPHAAWAGAEARRKSDFADGLDTSILVLEDPRREVNWMEPRDLTLEVAKQLLTSTPLEKSPHPPQKNFFCTVYRGRQAAFADGAVHEFGLREAESAVSPLLTIDDGEPPATSRALPIGLVRRWNWPNLISLTTLVALVLFPLRKALPNPLNAVGFERTRRARATG